MSDIFSDVYGAACVDGGKPGSFSSSLRDDSTGASESMLAYGTGPWKNVSPTVREAFGALRQSLRASKERNDRLEEELADIKQLIGLKADRDFVASVVEEHIKGDVSYASRIRAAEQHLKSIQSDLALKADSAYVAECLLTKANKSDVMGRGAHMSLGDVDGLHRRLRKLEKAETTSKSISAKLDQKASKTSVSGALHRKANKEDVQKSIGALAARVESIASEKTKVYQGDAQVVTRSELRAAVRDAVHETRQVADSAVKGLSSDVRRMEEQFESRGIEIDRIQRHVHSVLSEVKVSVLSSCEAVRDEAIAEARAAVERLMGAVPDKAEMRRIADACARRAISSHLETLDTFVDERRSVAIIEEKAQLRKAAEVSARAAAESVLEQVSRERAEVLMRLAALESGIKVIDSNSAQGDNDVTVGDEVEKLKDLVVSLHEENMELKFASGDVDTSTAPEAGAAVPGGWQQSE